jgi:hypothetical protein
MKNKFNSPNLKEVFLKRITNNLKDFPFDLLNYFDDKIYIGGGALISNEPNDIDIYYKNFKSNFNLEKFITNNDGKIILTTKNAITVKFNNTVFQFCNYWKDNLEDLIESFDFAHIKIGIELYTKKLMYSQHINVDIENSTLYISPDYNLASLIGSTYYTGSEYPMSSLIRIIKYIKRDCFKGKSYLPEIFKIITDINNRGFDNYNDFLNQLDAVDLGLLPKDISEIENANDIFLNFFETLNKNK